MKRKVFFLLLITIFAVSLTYSPMANAFDDNAHEALSQRAAEVSTLDSFLKSVLPFEFANGRSEVIFNGRRVEQLIVQGAVDEDRPIAWRPRHHFHNPRLAWDQAGWRPPPFSIQLGDSSVKWSQNENQTVGGKHSWKDARDTFFQALTATTDSERKPLYAETFKSLGHLIHLVQDAAVPSHTRNDTHLTHAGIGNPDSFHGWAELATGAIGVTPPLFNSSLLNQSAPNAIAPAPIARIIDSTDGDIGTLALSPGLNIGIAEYSSANFFSDDTINSPNFQSPRSSQIEVRAPESDATGTKLRRYVYFRPGFGEQDYPLALASSLSSYVIDPLATPTENGLDGKVFQRYGAKLFPRAIGYSAGLIDYFFRGVITNDFEFVGGIPFAQRPSAIKVNDLTISDVSGNETVGAGEARLILRKVELYGNTLQNPLPPITGNFPEVLVSNPAAITGSPIPSPLSFTFDSLPFPTADLSDCICHQSSSYQAFLVFKGTLGQETEKAVAVGGSCPGYIQEIIFAHTHWNYLPEANQVAILGSC